MASKKEQMKAKIMQDSYLDPIVSQSFEKADTNKSGFIEVHELKVFLKDVYDSLMVPEPTEDIIQKELKRLDKNNDGKLSKEEFKLLVRDIAIYSIDLM